MTQKTRHKCLSSGQHNDELPYKCPHCHFTSASQRGISNHLWKHERRIYSDRNRQITNIDTADTHHNSTVENQATVEIERNLSPSLSAVTNQTPWSDLYEVVEYSDEENCQEDNPFENFLPNPDKKSPSNSFILRFKDLTEHYNND